MSIQTQYVIPILHENDNTWSQIHMLIQPLKCVSDEYGNLKDCTFSMATDKLIGDFHLFQTLDEQVAKIVQKEFQRDKNLTVLPIRKIQYAEQKRKIPSYWDSSISSVSDLSG